MAELTERQLRLLNPLNQLSQNIETGLTNSSVSKSFDLNLPGLLGFSTDLTLGPGSGTTDPGNGDEPVEPPNGGDGETPPESSPGTIIDALTGLINEQVEVTVPFGNVSGTLINVAEDYIVLVEANGDRTLVRTDVIELVRGL